jgi:hypothetical protein
VPVGNHIVVRTNKYTHRPNSLDLADAYDEVTDYDSCRMRRHGTTFRDFSRLTDVAVYLRYNHGVGTRDASVEATPGGRI